MVWKPGQSGNPAGRKPGSRNRASQMLETLLDGQAEALVQKAVELALQGNPAMLKMCLERLAPAPRGPSVQLDLGSIEDSYDLFFAQVRVLKALAAGQISVAEAAGVTKIIESTKALL